MDEGEEEELAFDNTDRNECKNEVGNKILIKLKHKYDCWFILFILTIISKNHCYY